MSSVLVQVPSGSEGDPQDAIDLRKQKRKLSNRESARRSRQKKRQHLQELGSQIAYWNEENSRILMQINMLAEKYDGVESENAILRSRVTELIERLRYLNSVLHFMEDFSGVPMDIPGTPEPLLKPWKLPCPAQQIMVSADMLRF